MSKMIEYTPNTMVGTLLYIRAAPDRYSPAGHKRRMGIFLCSVCSKEMQIGIAEAVKGQKYCRKCRNIGERNPSYRHGHAVGGKEQYNSTYRIFSNMMRRCYSKNATGYENYGGRGIKVCDRWIGSEKGEGYKNFYEDMGPRPSVNHSIDRINTNGDYEPTNCKWSTIKEQNSNKRNSTKELLNILIKAIKVYEETDIEKFKEWIIVQLERSKVTGV